MPFVVFGRKSYPSTQEDLCRFGNANAAFYERKVRQFVIELLTLCDPKKAPVIERSFGRMRNSDARYSSRAMEFNRSHREFQR